MFSWTVVGTMSPAVQYPGIYLLSMSLVLPWRCYWLLLGTWNDCVFVLPARILTRLLEVSDDPQVIAVAAHDVGEYVRHYPRGKRWASVLHPSSINGHLSDSAALQFYICFSVPKYPVALYDYSAENRPGYSYYHLWQLLACDDISANLHLPHFKDSSILTHPGWAIARYCPSLPFIWSARIIGQSILDLRTLFIVFL